MQLIEALYYGSLVPSDFAPTANSKESSECLKLAIRHEECLKDSLSATEQEIFQKYVDCLAEHHSIESQNAFVSGFRIAVRLMTEALSTEK